jgi:uncharacterized RDD family membrane protein YckC
MSELHEPSYPAAPAPVLRPAGMVFDEASGLYLPLGVEVASAGRRVAAALLSLVLIAVTLGVGWLAWGMAVWRRGTTPALQVLGMHCWSLDDGDVPGFGRMARREIAGRLADVVLGPITLAVSFAIFVTGVKRQSLHDLVARTTVVRDPGKGLG